MYRIAPLLLAFAITLPVVAQPHAPLSDAAREEGASSDDDAASLPVAFRVGIDQEAKLVASDGAAFDLFGSSVSLSGERALIGTNSGSEHGAAYVFVRSGDVWTQEAKLTSDDAADFALFGSSVSLSGERVLIGAPTDTNSLGDRSGAAYIFVRSGDGWSQEAKLEADDANVGDDFGSSVSLSGDRALVGASFGDDDPGSNSGAAYVFVRSGEKWVQEGKLTAEDAAMGDRFGSSVSLSGDRALVGANRNDDAGSEGGSAYVFVYANGEWAQEAKLLAFDTSKGDSFGGSVSLSGDRALIGAFRNDGGADNAGAAYTFVRSTDSWAQEEKLTAADADVGDLFGVSVSILGDRALVGAFGDDDPEVNSGTAYVFVRSDEGWVQERKLEAEDAEEGGSFGSSVSLSSERALVGAVRDDNGGTDSGSAYVFSGFAPVAAEPETEAADIRLEAAPNPARDATILRLTLPTSTAVTVIVFDALGRRVATLHEGALAAGTHALHLDGSALPSGVYLVRAEANGGVLTRRVTLLH